MRRGADGGVAYETAERTIVTSDPWGNVVRFMAP